MTISCIYNWVNFTLMNLDDRIQQTILNHNIPNTKPEITIESMALIGRAKSIEGRRKPFTEKHTETEIIQSQKKIVTPTTNMLLQCFEEVESSYFSDHRAAGDFGELKVRG